MGHSYYSPTKKEIDRQWKQQRESETKSYGRGKITACVLHHNEGLIEFTFWNNVFLIITLADILVVCEWQTD